MFHFHNLVSTIQEKKILRTMFPMHVSMSLSYRFTFLLCICEFNCSLIDSRPADTFLCFNVSYWEVSLVFICVQMLLLWECPFWEWDELAGSAQQQRAFCSWCHCSCFDWQGADWEAPPPGSFRLLSALP